MNHRSQFLSRSIVRALPFAVLLAACGDDGDTQAPGATATGGGTQSSSSSNQASSASGSGAAGATGGGGTGATGGTGGSGGAPVSCLAASEYADLFAIQDPGYCVVALYDSTEALGFQAPSWGRHGGPLTVAPAAAAGSVDLTRWSLPAGPKGSLTAQKATVDAAIPDGAFLSPQPLDLPIFDWTVVAYSGAFPNTQGEAIAIKNGAVAARYDVNAYYGGAGTASGVDAGRLVYTGYSIFGDASGATNALFAADSCGTAANPSLLPTDPSCSAPAQVVAWGDNSGPVAADEAGNVFALMTSFDGTQEARGFEASTIAQGAPPTDGDTLFTLPGFGSTLAALAPSGAEPGLVAFQPSDPTSFAALDVVSVTFKVAGKAVKPDGDPKAFLQLATAGTALALLSDGSGRMWVAAPSASGGTTYAVVTRSP